MKKNNYLIEPVRSYAAPAMEEAALPAAEALCQSGNLPGVEEEDAGFSNWGA